MAAVRSAGRTFRIISLGCAKNQVDSEAMQQLLLAEGHREAADEAEAEVLIVNTCGFIEAAKQESIETLLELAQRKRPGQRLIAAGCLSERYRGELLQAIPEIDGLLGARNWGSIAGLVERVARADRQPGSSLALMELAPWGELDLAMRRRQASGPSAYVKISDGCDQRCAFCAIPSFKGSHRSKPPELILAEVGELLAQGVREVVLIGQDTTRYGHDLGLSEGLARLLEAICDRYPALPWVRVMYAYPKHVTAELLRVMAERPQVCKYLDMPLQHTHPETLRRMRRPHRGVAELVHWIREAVPGIALRTTFIVGFPGETEEEFACLCQSVHELEFDRIGVFAYSDEEGTPAFELPGRVPKWVRERRRRELMALAGRLSKQRNTRLVGARLPVLVEGTTEDASERLLVGRSYRDAPEVDGLVLARGRAEIGAMVEVRVTEALEYDLLGVVEAGP